MLWYGKVYSENFKKLYKRSKYRCNLKTRSLALSIPQRSGLTRAVYSLYIPSNWNFQVLVKSGNNRSVNNQLIYLYNNVYFFKFLTIGCISNFYFDQQTNSITFHLLYTPAFYKMYWNNLLTVFYSFSKLFFKKLKFKGKGYYIYKNVRNTITPQFGHAHRIYMYSFYLSVKFLTKTTVFLFGSSKQDILTTAQLIHVAKPINVFTGRGVRFSRQVVYRKTGKVSSYR